MTKRYLFKQSISGSNNGYTITDYNKNDIVEEENICEYLTKVWLKAGIIEEIGLGEDVDVFSGVETNELPEGAEEITEAEAENIENSSANAEDAGTNENESGLANIPEDEKNCLNGTSVGAELTDERIGELIFEAKEILEIPEGANLSDEDIAKLKQIGIELKIEGMQSSKKPQTILDKINNYIDEYENVGDDIPQG